MSRVIKYYIYLLSLLFILLPITGCILHPVIGPGYTVSISVNDNVHLTNTDIAFLDHVAVEERFGHRRTTASSDKWECIHYGRDLDEPQYKHLQKYKFLTLGWCYDVRQPASETQRNIKQFYINIANDWGGQEPTIKQEIDRIAEVFYKGLTVRFGKENIKIDRRRTGPPF